MPHSAPRPLTQIRPSPRVMGFGRPRFPTIPPRMPFRPRIGSRAPFGFGFGFGRPSIGGSDIAPAGRMPPRQKILVNPHFRGPSAPGVVQSQAPSTPSTSAYPNLLSLEVVRPTQQPPQFTVKLTKLD